MTGPKDLLRFPPSPHRPLDDGPRHGTEVWRTLEGVVFHHWDRWLLRLALDEPRGLDALRTGIHQGLLRSRSRDSSAEAMLAQVDDLQQRLDRLHLSLIELLDETERASEWLRAKAQKRVWQDGPHAPTEAMWHTPRRRLVERSLRGFWPLFPVSPARFEEVIRHPFSSPSSPGQEVPFSLLTLDLVLPGLERAVASDAERLALYRAVMTLLLEEVAHVQDEGWELAMAYRACEASYLSVVRSFLDVPAVVHDLIARVTWEDHGLSLHAPAIFRELSHPQARLALSLLDEDLRELRQAGLGHEAGKAESLRHAVLSSHPTLAPALDGPASLASVRPATTGATITRSPPRAPWLAPTPASPSPSRVLPAPVGDQREPGRGPSSSCVLPPTTRPPPAAAGALPEGSAAHEAPKAPARPLDGMARGLSSNDPAQVVFWGEAWLLRFPKGGKGRMHRRLAEAYEEQGRLDDAVEVLWRGFVAAPSVAMFRALRRRATRLGEWSWWRQHALEHLRIAPTEPREAASVLVAIWLSEGQVKSALREARRRPCQPGLWAVLAEALVEAHPLEAIAIYRDHVSRKLRTRGSARGFAVATAPLQKLARNTPGTDVEPTFQALLRWLREEHAHYRHVLAFLDTLVTT